MNLWPLYSKFSVNQHGFIPVMLYIGVKSVKTLDNGKAELRVGAERWQKNVTIYLTIFWTKNITIIFTKSCHLIMIIYIA